MAVKTELIARLLAQIKDFQRQFARAVSRNSPPRTVTFEVDGRPLGVTIPPIKIPAWSSKPDQEWQGPRKEPQ